MRLQEYSANDGSPVTAAMNNLRAEPVSDACEWLDLEHLALGSERVGGMVVRSARVRHRQRAGGASVTFARVGAGRSLRHLQLLEPGRDAGRIASLRACARCF